MKLLRILLITLLFGVSASGFAQSLGQNSVAESEKQTIEVTINSEKFYIPSAKQNIRVDVFSIIGAKVASFDIKSGIGESNVNLPQGYYIIKADNTSRKIAVK